MKYIKKNTFLGEPALQAGNEKLEFILVPGWGSNLISLISKDIHCELLRVPETVEAYQANPCLYGIPVLFPPNRIEDGVFCFGGRTYQWEINEPTSHNHIHGCLYQLKWDVVQAEIVEERVEIVTEIHSEQHLTLYKQFPHRFTMKMAYRLEGATLSKQATILNRDEEPFPWGLGFHTTFRFPIGQTSTLDDCTLALTVDKRWKLNERLLPTGELEEIKEKEQFQRGISLKNKSLDDAFLSLAYTGGENQATICDRKAGIQVIYQCDSHFKHWVVYNGDGTQGFLCPEPYTWITNAPNLNLPPSLTGVQVLSPGEQVKVKSTISVFLDESV
ncbi:aldose 1-epimerase [Thermoflavimicrobium dichotomicum]|uniref:Aldose 1-epimerase n=1 Tax=Thermoflavimicrobium dichotomicum TaxID=46223 RepID=A0A1I3P158_9BACL|nr:aldose 1-epimerase [Thermoflavimicrobium dichotomicum]SFJ15030.1 aldose 1-epimerase [Thermoflavimicrobium dichotomicum]